MNLVLVEKNYGVNLSYYEICSELADDLIKNKIEVEYAEEEFGIFKFFKNRDICAELPFKKIELCKSYKDVQRYSDKW